MSAHPSWWVAAWTQDSVTRLSSQVVLPVSGREFCEMVRLGIVRPDDPAGTSAACAAGMMGDSRVTVPAGSVHIQASRIRLGRKVVADLYSVGDPRRLSPGQTLNVVSPQANNPMLARESTGTLWWQRIRGEEVPMPPPPPPPPAPPRRAGIVAVVLLLAVGVLIWRHTSG